MGQGVGGNTRLPPYYDLKLTVGQSFPAMPLNFKKRYGKRATSKRSAYTKRGRVTRTFRAGTGRRVGNYGRYHGATTYGKEIKYLDSVTNTTGLQAGDTLEFLDPALDLIEGVRPQQRIGRKIWLKSLQVKLNLMMKSGSDAPESDSGTFSFTIIIVKDTQCNGVTATLAEIFQILSATQGEMWQLAFNNLENSGRFKTIYKKEFIVNTRALLDNPGGGGPDDTSFSGFGRVFNINLKTPCVINYSGSTGNTIERRSNNLVGFIMHNLSRPGQASTGSPVEVNAHMRIRYTDC